ncbi:MAG: c-type cytochrome [Chlamydiales bacterium]|nr:c-type cytochrome [Chlamydiales bacterium]
MKYQDFYQYTLLLFAAVVLFAIGAFVYKELFPEYKEYQYAYKKLEKIRSEETGEKPAPFHMGIKQILIPDPQNGPELIDRCTSCHVAMNLEHFSPTRVALDVNANPMIDVEGNPVLEPNPDYVWNKVPPHSDLRKYEGALQMHPLIGSETKPFEHHPMDEYGCTVCHSGNGRALVVERAHGPIKDGEYHPADSGHKPQFLEKDEKNDPKFASHYNNKPGHDLVFQTTPLLTGPLMVAKCMQCHQTFSGEIASAVEKVNLFEKRKKEQLEILEKGAEDEKKALIALLNLHRLIQNEGQEKTEKWLGAQLGNPSLSPTKLDAYSGQLTFLKEHRDIEKATMRIVGTQKSTLYLLEKAKEAKSEQEIANFVSAFLVKHQAQGGWYEKQERIQKETKTVEHFEGAKEPLMLAVQDKEVVDGLKTHLDALFAHYQRGKELYVSQGCYACHRIAGFSRASVGPELTQIGLSYPWFVKESIVWPQADLPSSTMPNFQLDHEEVADLMAFLMAQTKERKVVSEVDHQVSLAAWEAGEKLPWEKPISPPDIHNLSFGQMVYATEGCASCHKLEGFDTGVTTTDPDWFYQTFPERILGSALAQKVLEVGEAIDQKIEEKGHDTVLAKVEAHDPELIPGFYPNFKFAGRAQNHALSGEALAQYKRRLRKVLMLYIKQYGLGRDIAPPLNWAGVYRDDAWLLGHFHNPAAYTARSLMPVMPFDDTKFYALNYMLKTMGAQNRETLQQLWSGGFNSPQAYDLLCSTCHGSHRQGNGVIAEWIYPVPKNLRNPVFLRNLTKERAIDSIMHGVDGTPMPPWGEGVLTEGQVTQLVDWLYQGLPSSPRAEMKEDYEKWHYSVQDVVDEMVKENDLLQPVPTPPSVHGYFEQQPGHGPDKELYYIRDEYYTQSNLNEIRPFYNINCAVCHGKEGTGAGLRATSMVEAKPRMFTNLPWIQTRDDLRLIRSIKYGVPGTAMTPWGDQTTSKQRMQLTLLIRAFTRASVEREKLGEVLYNTFDTKIIALEEARIPNYTELQALEEKLKKATCEELPQLHQEIAEKRANDNNFVEKIAHLHSEQELFQSVGSQLIAKEVPMSNFYLYMETCDPQDLELTLHYIDSKIEEYKQKLEKVGINTADPLLDKPAQEIIELQRGFINLKAKLMTIFFQ